MAAPDCDLEADSACKFGQYQSIRAFSHRIPSWPALTFLELSECLFCLSTPV